MKRFLIFLSILGVFTSASATPIITGPDILWGSADTITLTVEGTMAEASGGTAGNTNTPPGGFSGWIWVDYLSYSYQLSAPSGWTSNVGGSLSTFDTTSYLPIGGGFKFTATSDSTWSEATDVDVGPWFTFDLSTLSGAEIGDTYEVQILDGNFNILSSFEVYVVIPEPITIALLGLGGLFLHRRKN